MDAKERMKIPRQKMPEQKPEVRAKNFDEVPFGYEDEAYSRPSDASNARNRNA